MSRYIVRYRLNIDSDKGEINESDVPDNWGIASIKEGFWVDEFGGVNPLQSTIEYWIPPSQILGIRIKHHE